jgi:polar amino acid transport system substrate-binding protein
MKVKRCFAFVLALVMVFSMLTGCAKDDAPVASNEGERVISNNVADYDYEFGPLMTAAIESGEFGPILTRVLEEGVLKVGLNATDPPWQFHKIVDGEDQIFGFDKAICQWIGDEIGRIFGVEVTVEFEDTTWDGCLTGVAAGQYDIVPGAAATEERRKNMDFSPAFHKSRQVIVTHVDNLGDPMFSAENALKDVQVGVLKGSMGAIILVNHYPNTADNLYELGSNNDVLLAVLNKKCQAANFNEKYSILMCKANPELAIVDELTFEPTMEEDGGSCIAHTKGNDDFNELLNEFIPRVLSDGTFAQMEKDALEALNDPDLLEQFQLLNQIPAE